MSVLPMKHVRVLGLHREKKQVLRLLQRLGVVEIHEVHADSPVFQNLDMTETIHSISKCRAEAEDALAILEKYVPEDKGILASLEGPEDLTAEEYEQREKKLAADDTEGKAKQILSLDHTLSEQRAQIPHLESQMVALEPWLPFDLPLDFQGTETTVSFIGTLPGKRSADELRSALSDSGAEECVSEIISADQTQTCIFIVVSKGEKDKAAEGLRRLNFSKPMLDFSSLPRDGTAKSCKTYLQNEISDAKEKIKTLEQEITSMASCREDLHFLSDSCQMKEEQAEAEERLLQSKHTFILEGYAPEKVTKQLEERLKKFEICYEEKDPEPDEDVPVILKNNGFAAPVEGVVDSYSLPGKGERDPSTLVALFYYILFGFMLSDAGYGLIMVIASAILLKKFPRMQSGLKKTLKMLQYCGIATTVVGFLFGSFFGNAVNVIASTFFNRPDIALNAIWLDPLKEPMRMLGICFIVGIIHLFVGLGAKLYADIKDGHVLDGIYDCVFWYMFAGGLILVLLTMSMVTNMFGNQPLAGIWRKIGGWAALIGFVGIVLTSGRESKNWFKRILKGLYGAYGISSWLSDILSYSRLLALGLATSVISQVFNTMGSMVAKGRGVLGVIVFIVIFVIGHTLNLLINALGAYVHTNRLTFVEFFGKFYEGGGRKFKPFTENTKYIKVSDN